MGLFYVQHGPGHRSEHSSLIAATNYATLYGGKVVTPRRPAMDSALPRPARPARDRRRRPARYRSEGQEPATREDLYQHLADEFGLDPHQIDRVRAALESEDGENRDDDDGGFLPIGPMNGDRALLYAEMYRIREADPYPTPRQLAIEAMRRQRR